MYKRTAIFAYVCIPILMFLAYFVLPGVFELQIPDLGQPLFNLAGYYLVGWFIVAAGLSFFRLQYDQEPQLETYDKPLFFYAVGIPLMPFCIILLMLLIDLLR